MNKGILGLVLAGGQGRRMGGRDKAQLVIGGETLVKRAVRRLGPGVDRLLISGETDYGLGCGHLPDRTDGARGPVAALHAVQRWGAAHPEAGIAAVLTVPVDVPFFPDDLVARLAATGSAAMAATAKRVHPTLAFWPLDTLAAAAPLLATAGGLPMQRLAEAVGATVVPFDDEDAFLNINRPQDLARAEALLAAASRRRKPGLSDRGA